jgi:5'-deoxynucleotidase YfbR-like HD superfamily hydrolase
MIAIDDIAHHLSMVCRWAGATQSFYSVAQHSCLVAKICPPELQRWALLHDAAEAYIGDMTRPMKALMRDLGDGEPSPFDAVETGIMRCVAEKFELSWPEPKELQQYDDQIQKLEGLRFIRHDGKFHARSGEVTSIDDIDPKKQIPAILLEAMLPRSAEMLFMAAFRRLFLDDDGL